MFCHNGFRPRLLGLLIIKHKANCHLLQIHSTFSWARICSYDWKSYNTLSLCIDPSDTRERISSDGPRICVKEVASNEMSWCFSIHIEKYLGPCHVRSMIVACNSVDGTETEEMSLFAREIRCHF